MTDKKALRSELIAARDGIPAELHAELSAAVCRNILSMPEYAACDTLLGYCPIGSEWDIRPVLRDAAASGRRIALPRCDRASHTMTFFIISSEEDIEIGEYGIPAPRIGCPAYIDTPQALCLVPALALDARGRRIGYGGGYYDRFLAHYRGAAVLLCRERLLRQEIPFGVHDYPIPWVLTEA